MLIGWDEITIVVSSPWIVKSICVLVALVVGVTVGLDEMSEVVLKGLPGTA